MISLRCLTTSILLEYLAVSARQRIMFFVSGVGCFKSVWSNCRFCFSWSTISFGLHDGDTSDSATLPGRASVLSSLSKGMERVGLFHSFKTVNLASLTYHSLSKNLQRKFLPFKVPIAQKICPGINLHWKLDFLRIFKVGKKRPHLKRYRVKNKDPKSGILSVK